MTKIITEDIGAFNQHFPKVVIIVSAQAKGKANAMAAAWHTSLSVNPPYYGIAISPKRSTYQMIIDSKEFGINFLPFEAAELIASVGGSSGLYLDKFQQFRIIKEKPLKTSAPILKTAYAAFECRLIDDRVYGDHNLLVGEIVAVHILEKAFTQQGTLDLNKISPVLYLGQELYLTTAKDTLRTIAREVYGKY